MASADQYLNNNQILNGSGVSIKTPNELANEATEELIQNASQGLLNDATALGLLNNKVQNSQEEDDTFKGLSLNKRLFGEDMPMSLKKKLEARQLFGAGLNIDSVRANAKFLEEDDLLVNQSILGFGAQDGGLNNQTTFARMWTAVSLRSVNPDKVRKTENDEKPPESEIMENEYWDTSDKKIKTLDQVGPIKIYELGTKDLNIFGLDTVSPTDPVLEGDGMGLYYEVFPYHYSSQEVPNEFMKPGPGIVSINSTTEGIIGALKRTTVDFVVHNFHDYDNIYSKYFLRPGAQIFVDFGHSSNATNLYMPHCVIDPETHDHCGEWLYDLSPEDRLYGELGFANQEQGDMQTLIGHVESYTANIQSNGSVACSVTIASKNQLLLSRDLESEELDNLKKDFIRNLDINIMKEAATYFSGPLADRLTKANISQDLESEMDWREIFASFGRNKLGTSANTEGAILSNTPGSIAQLVGVFFSGTREHLNDDTNAIFVNWGFFEDKILNKEFGMGGTLGKILSGGSFEARFDSSNSFVTYNGKLFERQKLEREQNNLIWLYPSMWEDSASPDYNFGHGKIPYRYQSDKEKAQASDQTVWQYDASAMNRIPMRQIWVSVKEIKESIMGASSVAKFLESLLRKMSSYSIGLWDLQFSSNSNDQILVVTDRNFVLNDNGNSEDYTLFENLFEFKPGSPTSICKNIDIQFSTPQGGLQNMVAIQAMAADEKMIPLTNLIDKALGIKLIENRGSGLDTYVRYEPNPGEYRAKKLRERLSGLSITNDSLDTDIQDHISLNQKYKEALDNLGGISGGGGLLTSAAFDKANTSGERLIEEKEFYSYWSYDPATGQTEKVEPSEDEVEEKKRKHKGITHANSLKEKYEMEARKEFAARELPTVLPVNATLTIDGIALLSPGFLFRIDYLPERYRNHVYFQITKVTNTLNNGSWSTTFDSVMRLHGIAKKDIVDPDSQNEEGSGNELGNPIESNDNGEIFLNQVPIDFKALSKGDIGLLHIDAWSHYFKESVYMVDSTTKWYTNVFYVETVKDTGDPGHYKYIDRKDAIQNYGQSSSTPTNQWSVTLDNPPFIGHWPFGNWTDLTGRQNAPYFANAAQQWSFLPEGGYGMIDTSDRAFRKVWTKDNVKRTNEWIQSKYYGKNWHTKACKKYKPQSFSFLSKDAGVPMCFGPWIGSHYDSSRVRQDKNAGIDDDGSVWYNQMEDTFTKDCHLGGWVKYRLTKRIDEMCEAMVWNETDKNWSTRYDAAIYAGPGAGESGRSDDTANNDPGRQDDTAKEMGKYDFSCMIAPVDNSNDFDYRTFYWATKLKPETGYYIYTLGHAWFVMPANIKKGVRNRVTQALKFLNEGKKVNVLKENCDTCSIWYRFEGVIFDSTGATCKAALDDMGDDYDNEAVVCTEEQCARSGEWCKWDTSALEKLTPYQQSVQNYCVNKSEDEFPQCWES